MSKSIFFSCLLFALPFSVNAEYMGISDVPVSNSDVNKVFMSSVKGKDFKAIDAWKDQIFQVYDQKNFCAYSANTIIHEVKESKELLDYPTEQNKFRNVMGYDYVAIVPSECSSISLWSLYNKLGDWKYSYDVFSNVGALNLLNSNNSHKLAAEAYSKNQSVIIDFMKKIPNDKYALFLPIILQNDSDFTIRNLAFDKYVEGRDAEASKKTDEQDLIFQLKKKMTEAREVNTSYVSTFNDKMYMSLFQPDLLILTEMNKKALNALHSYWGFYKNKVGQLPPFSKSVIAKGGYSDEEIKGLNLQQLDDIHLYHFYNTNQTIRLFFRAFENYKKNHGDLNVQKDDGNTMLSEMISNGAYRLTNSPFAGSFIRFYLENGANPLLQNKNGDTAFSAFIKKYGENIDTYEIKKAFVQKQYDFNQNEIGKK